jgi:hypothetical protein
MSTSVSISLKAEHIYDLGREHINREVARHSWA